MANSLKLTQTQAEQLAVALKQFRSIHSVSSAKYVQLADRACDVGIMVAAAAAERARAGWGATGAASASHITGGNGNPALSASQQTSGASGLQHMGTPATSECMVCQQITSVMPAVLLVGMGPLLQQKTWCAVDMSMTTVGQWHC